MRRNNEERLMQGHRPQPTEDAPMANPLDFIAPTQLVDLPSKGRYPEGHPLHGKETVEIKFMTAKDEDILTNRSLLKKGLAIDRLIQNVIKDESINAKDLYVGDRNSIVLYARASAYGDDYRTKVKCPQCGEANPFVFMLSDHQVYHGDLFEEAEIEDLGDGTFNVVLPVSSVHARIRPLTGRDEIELTKDKKDPLENIYTNQMKRFVVSYNQRTDQDTIQKFSVGMPAVDSRYLRECFRLISPDVKMESNFECQSCGHEEVINVPLGTDFFWPDR
jgi:predicted RNA-binding Zn-ribbon protein involved in translation (DUF1610 family)